MTDVIKRGGKTQKFNPSKIKKAVTGALKEAKVPPKMRAKIVREVTSPVIKACRKKKTVKALVIRNLVVKKLRAKSKEAAAAWTKYERRHKRRSHAKRKPAKKRTAKRRVAHHRKRRR